MIKYVNRPNKSNIIKGVYEIIEPLFNSKLTVDEFKKLTISHVIYNFIELELYKERIAKTPFKNGMLKVIQTVVYYVN